jgi:hypothetical protein
VKLPADPVPKATILNRSQAILVYDEAKGELRVEGQRYAAVQVKAMCEHLDTLVGTTLAETIMNSHQRRQGVENAERIRELDPNAKIEEMLRVLAEDDRIAGFGIPKVTITESAEQPAKFEIYNPVVTATEGAGKVFIVSYWAGALSVLLGKEVDPTNMAYDPAKNTMSCSFLKRN